MNELSTKTYHGPVNSNNERVRYWYDRSLRLWTAYVVDAEDNQLGSTQYEYSKGDIALDVSSYEWSIRR